MAHCGIIINDLTFGFWTVSDPQNGIPSHPNLAKKHQKSHVLSIEILNDSACLQKMALYTYMGRNFATQKTGEKV